MQFVILNVLQDSGSNIKKLGDDNYETDKKEPFTKVSKYHSRDSLETPEEIDKDIT